MKWFGKLAKTGAPGKAEPDGFDLFNRKALEAIARERNSSLGNWSIAEAETSVEGAARVALGLLRQKRALHQRFPMATLDPDYREWLRRRGPTLGLSPQAAQNIESAFDAQFGQRVLDFYLHSPELQFRFPYGLLPVGQGKFLKWLLREGREKHGLSEVEILWFLHQTAEQMPQMIHQTWLINPRWQELHPFGLTSGGREDFIRWLRAEFGLGAKQLRALPLLPQNSEPLLRARLAGERKQTGARGANVLSHFCYPSGIQQAAANIRGALESVGWTISARDLPTSPVTDIKERAPFFGLELYPVTITNVAPAPHFRDAYKRAGLLRREGIYRIAYWAWELEEIPQDWVQLAPLIDEIWAPTPFVAEAFRRSMPVPVHEILPGLELGEIAPVTRASLGIPEENYVFLFMFDMASQMERKNPLAVIRAFATAFPRPADVSLVIKVARGGARPAALAQLKAEAEIAGALVVDEIMPHAQAYGILQMCDCFVSLHRSEGFGLCLAEAMLLGKPVIATNYSGNRAFMHPGNSLLVDYTLTEILEDMPTYKKGNRWAEASLEHAAAQMRYCYENREAAAALGAIGRAEIREKFSLKAAGARMAARLADSGNA